MVSEFKLDWLEDLEEGEQFSGGSLEIKEVEGIGENSPIGGSVQYGANGDNGEVEVDS